MVSCTLPLPNFKDTKPLWIPHLSPEKIPCMPLRYGIKEAGGLAKTLKGKTHDVASFKRLYRWHPPAKTARQQRTWTCNTSTTNVDHPHQDYTWTAEDHLASITRKQCSDPYSLNPDRDPAKNLNPDPDPSYFLTLSEIFFFRTS